MREETKGPAEYEEQGSCMTPNVESIFEEDHEKLHMIASFLVFFFLINKKPLKTLYKCKWVCGYKKKEVMVDVRLGDSSVEQNCLQGKYKDVCKEWPL